MFFVLLLIASYSPRRLRDDLKHQSEELAALNARFRESQIALSDAQGQLLPVQFELTKTIREKDLLSVRVEELVAAQTERQNELIELRRKHSSRVVALEASLSTAQALAQERADRVKALEDRLHTQEEKTKEHLTKIGELETAAAIQKGQYDREVDGLNQLVRLHETHSADARRELKELEEAHAVLKEVTGRQISQLKDALHTHARDAEEARASERAVLKGRVAELEAALKEQQLARGVLTVVESATESGVSTASVAAGVAGSNMDGLSPIEMMDRLRTAEMSHFSEQARRKQAETYLNKIMIDMQNMEPVIISQKRDMQRALESHENLKHRLDVVSQENSQLREQVRVAIAKCARAEEDATALAQHNSDLSSQLQHLIKRSMDQQFGTIGTRPPVALIGYGGEGSCGAGGVISEHLLTFDDVSELQTRNAQLLKVVRKLSQEQEQLEARAQAGSGVLMLTDADPTPSLALSAALEELGALKESRLRTEEMVKTLVQQRDLYKAMLDEADTTIAATSMSGVGGMGGWGGGLPLCWVCTARPRSLRVAPLPPGRTHKPRSCSAACSSWKTRRDTSPSAWRASRRTRKG